MDMDGKVPSILSITPKSARYHLETNQLELTDSFTNQVNIFFHNQNQEIPFSGELQISINPM